MMTSSLVQLHLNLVLSTLSVFSSQDFDKPFTLYANTSLTGLLTVRMQPDDRGTMRIFGYQSRIFHGTTQFCDIIPNNMSNDNKEVTKFFNRSKQPIATIPKWNIARWYETVLQYDLTLHHVTGNAFDIADALFHRLLVAPDITVRSLTDDIN